MCELNVYVCAHCDSWRRRSLAGLVRAYSTKVASFGRRALQWAFFFLSFFSFPVMSGVCFVFCVLVFYGRGVWPERRQGERERDGTGREAQAATSRVNWDR